MLGVRCYLCVLQLKGCLVSPAGGTEIKAEIIPIERNRLLISSFFQAPDPDNTGVGTRHTFLPSLLGVRYSLWVCIIIINVLCMTLSEWFALFGQQLAETPFIQWVALALGVAEVLFAKANKIWLYPTGIAATCLSIFILFEAGLYAECLLNLYYIVMSVYGWWYWVKKKNEPPINITRSSRQDWITVLAIVGIGFALLSFCLHRFTPSTVPYWDAWVSATAWAGMWLLAKRKIENWILLNVSNAFAIPLLIHKDLPLYAALTLFLFIVAVFGYIKWNKILKASATEEKLALI